MGTTNHPTECAVYAKRENTACYKANIQKIIGSITVYENTTNFIPNKKNIGEKSNNTLHDGLNKT
jgi:hypothetical protein